MENKEKNFGLDAPYAAVKEFHKAFGHPAEEAPTTMDSERARSRIAWMQEEITEFAMAAAAGDLAEEADAMIDLIYFALGTLVEMGVRPQPLFDIVQNANMSKLWPDGKPHYRTDGKIQKPAAWKDPYHKLKEELRKQFLESPQSKQY